MLPLSPFGKGSGAPKMSVAGLGIISFADSGGILGVSLYARFEGSSLAISINFAILSKRDDD